MTQHPGRCGSAGWSIITQGDHKLLGLIPRWGGGGVGGSQPGFSLAVMLLGLPFSLCLSQNH